MIEMKPEDVMKALMACASAMCFDCPLWGNENCVRVLAENALALLREKDAQKAVLQKVIETCENQLAEKDAEIERLTKDFLDYQADVKMEISDARAEAIDEFAQRLKRFYANLKGKTVGGSVEYHIAQIAKELKGEQA